MNGLSLFSGTAIGELAFKHIIPGYQTVGYVEWDEYCCRVIEQRIKDGVLDDAPIWQIDIREFNERVAPSYAGKVDFISGGFPCQPFSFAGARKAEADEQNQWPATRDAISLIRPRYALLENVPGLLAHKYIRRIFGDLAEVGYGCEWDVVGASDVGAPHHRKRVWILGWPSSDNVYGLGLYQGTGLSKQFWGTQFKGDLSNVATSWLVDNNIGLRDHDGVAHRVDRLKALGNGWCPQVVKAILQVDTTEED